MWRNLRPGDKVTSHCVVPRKENGTLSNTCAGILNMCFKEGGCDAKLSDKHGSSMRKLETPVKPIAKTTQSTSIVKVGLIYRHHGELGARAFRDDLFRTEACVRWF